MIDFVGKRKWYFLFSALVILVGVISLIAFGLKGGIEFTSGSTMTIDFEQTVEQADLRDEMANLGQDDAIIQRTGEDDFLIRTRELEPEVRDPVTGEVITPSEQQMIEEGLELRFGPLIVSDFYSVSPSMAKDIGRNAAIAVVVAAVGILLYITWAFRRLVKSFRFGVCAIVALVHDVLVVLGMYALLGAFFNLEITVMFIMGVLAIIGYSVNDTIVVFDRIRENMAKRSGRDIEETINNSILETLGRSLNTSLTCLFVLLALFLFGGATIHNFILVLIIGVISGTYSSVCIASQLLIVWEKGGLGRLFRRVRPRRVQLKEA
ncbi:MAG: protein translocase subunit SecF [Dehalococcoidia bacterium]|jgi:preprotein translocase subunit SecF|nr:protein translocase subunit SecF [Chloroflexota bacterium]MCK4242833.1 protein translocase subunit SecF [Dehalococcoidia bacterium]